MGVKQLFFVVTFFLFSLTTTIIAQGSVCNDELNERGAQPFCSISGVVFPNCNSSNADCTSLAELGPNYGCLDSQPFPAWYFLRINDSGSLVLNISQSVNEDGTGELLDVDFVCYGPFLDPVSPCASQLTSNNIVDCSFLADANENININNAISGQYYLVLITNFSEQIGFINFKQISGEGSTDCSILEAALGPDIYNCGLDPVFLDGENEEAIKYSWSSFNEFTSSYEVIRGEEASTLQVNTSGRYKIEIENSEGDIETDEVNVNLIIPPVIANPPLDLNSCEVLNSISDFDLASNRNLILGSQNELDFNVSFYTTIENALDRNLALPLNYSSSSTTIYGRIESSFFIECYEIAEFELIVDSRTNISSLDYKVSENSFSDDYTLIAEPKLLTGDLQNLEYKINDNEFQDSPIFNNVSSGENILSVRNKLNCGSSMIISRVIRIIDYPKFFTPNGDGVNDGWSLINSSLPITARIFIFDRFGKLLKQISASDNLGWDGTYLNKRMPSDNYWFLVEYIEPETGINKTITSTFVLIR